MDDRERRLYDQREHSYIKHWILTEYLRRAAHGIAKDGAATLTFNYIDALAGPWKIRDRVDYMDASFGRAMATMTRVRTELAESGIDVRLRFCFCEGNADAFKELKAYADRKQTSAISVFNGAFEDNLDAIERTIPDGFTFTFVDPFGWTVRHRKIFDFLKRREGEYMLNFMSAPINRWVGQESVRGSMAEFLCDQRWEESYRALPENLPGETKVALLVKRAMKEAGVATYVPDIPIMSRRADVIQMRMLLGTHSPESVAEFREVHYMAEFQEIAMRATLGRDAAVKMSLLSAEEHAEVEQRRAGVGSEGSRHVAEARVAELLDVHGWMNREDLQPRVMEFAHVRARDVPDLLDDMALRKAVTVVAPIKSAASPLDQRLALAGPLRSAKRSLDLDEAVHRGRSPMKILARSTELDVEGSMSVADLLRNRKRRGMALSLASAIAERIPSDNHEHRRSVAADIDALARDAGAADGIDDVEAEAAARGLASARASFDARREWARQLDGKDFDEAAFARAAGLRAEPGEHPLRFSPQSIRDRYDAEEATRAERAVAVAVPTETERLAGRIACLPDLSARDAGLVAAIKDVFKEGSLREPERVEANRKALLDDLAAMKSAPEDPASFLAKVYRGFSHREVEALAKPDAWLPGTLPDLAKQQRRNVARGLRMAMSGSSGGYAWYAWAGAARMLGEELHRGEA